MKLTRSHVLFSALLLSTMTMGSVRNQNQAGQHKTSESTKKPGFVSLPLSFEANHGQVDAKSLFVSRGHGYTLFLNKDEALLSLRKGSARTGLNHSYSTTGKVSSAATETVHMKLLGANRNVQLNGREQLPGKVNYIVGNDPAKWRTDVPTFAKVEYQSVYRGIDLIYYGTQQQLEYDFVVAPGANPRTIQLGLRTDSPKPGEPHIDSNGNLEIHTNNGDLRFLKPVAYQPLARDSNSETRQSVPAVFVLLGKNRVGFKIGNYDKSRPLVIDPVLSYSTYLGGSVSEFGTGIAVDSQGNAYVSGDTCTSEFLTGCDATVTKINAAGTAFLYSSIVGGSADDQGNAIAVNSAGEAYITGQTCSADFPVTAGAFQPSLAGACDAYVTKLDANGKQLYSTFLGGPEDPRTDSGDEGEGIAVDTDGAAYVGGLTCTPGFPTKNGFQQAQGGCDGFAVKLNPAGNGSSDLLYSTYLGSQDGVDIVNSVAVDSSKIAYFGGITTGDHFPTTSGAFQSSNAGFGDAFAVKLDMSKSGSDSFLYSTYLGGREGESTFGTVAIATDSDGNIYLTGNTGSANFPTTSGAFQPTRLPDTGDASIGVLAAFITKLKPAGKGSEDLVYSTFLGGNDPDEIPVQGERGSAITVGPDGKIHVAGDTCSKHFPVTSDAFQSSFSGPDFGDLNANNCDGFVVTINPAGQGQSDLEYATYLGGTGGDGVFGIALDQSGNTLVAGTTSSKDFPHSDDAPQKTLGGSKDIFVARLPIGGFLLAGPAPIVVDVGGSAGASVTVTSQQGFSSPVTLGISGQPGSVSATFDPNPVSPPANASASSTLTVKPGLATTPGTFTLNVTGKSGLVKASTASQLTVRPSSTGTITVINGITAAGCIDNSGISGALISKLIDAQNFINAGNTQDAINTLSALLNQLQAQTAKHISTSCTIDGVTFNPVEVLFTDVRALLATLKTGAVANPVMGYVVNANNGGVGGAQLSILGTSNTATTDSTGFYFFANTQTLAVGSTFTTQITAFPAGVTTSTPAAQTFTWQGTAVSLGNFVLGK